MTLETHAWIGKEFHVAGWGSAVFVVRWISDGSGGLARRQDGKTVTQVVPIARLYPTHETYKKLTGIDVFPAGISGHEETAEFRCWASDADMNTPGFIAPTNSKTGGCRKCGHSIAPQAGQPVPIIRFVPQMGYAHYVNWKRWCHLDTARCERQKIKQLRLFEEKASKRRKKTSQDPDIAADSAAGIYEAIDPYGDNGSAFFL